MVRPNYRHSSLAARLAREGSARYNNGLGPVLNLNLAVA